MTHPRHAITLGPYTYPHRESAKAHLRAMLRAPDGSPLPKYPARLASADEAAVVAALAHHVYADDLLSAPPARVEVRLNPPYMTPGLWVVYADGSAKHLSCKGFFKRSGPRHAAELRRAMRSEIEPQIRAVRTGARWPVTCPLTGRALTAQEAQVDHAHPQTFSALADGWLSEMGLEPPQIAVESDPASPAERRIADRRLAASWRAYHAQHARLRIVAGEANAALALDPHAFAK